MLRGFPHCWPSRFSSSSIHRISNILKTTSVPTEFDPRTYDYYVYTGETSDWSNTQTIIIPEGSVSTSTPNPSSNPTTTPTPTNTIPVDNSTTSQITSLALATIAILVIIVISLVLYVRHLKRSVTKPDNSTV